MFKYKAKIILPFFLVVVMFCFCGCAKHYYRSKPITDKMANHGLRITDPNVGGDNDDLFLFLAFSGGGTRAAAFSYGVLEALRDTPITLGDGQKVRLLDEVDAITSVSGGSFTSAYYGLYGDRIFEDFESKFLKKNVEGMLKRRIYSPWYWLKYLNPYYGFSEMAAEVYDKILFNNKKIGDFKKTRGPLIAIQATDIDIAQQFAFSPLDFQPICADLLDFPVSRAVVASSAVPVLFSSVIIENQAGACDYELPQWVHDELKKEDKTSRNYWEAKKIYSYTEREKRPYIHLLDGGLADNLGVRTVMERIFSGGEVIASLKELSMIDSRKIAAIIVNAEMTPSTGSTKSSKSISFMDAVFVGTGIPISRYNFETVNYMKSNFKLWKEELIKYNCPKQAEKILDGRLKQSETDCHDIDTYLIYMDFNLIDDEAESEFLHAVPTSFVLSDEEVDRLRAAARTILNTSPDFKKLVEDLNK